MHILKRIIGMARPYWLRIIGGIILSILVSGVTAAIAWFVKPALDTVIAEKKYFHLQLLPLGIIILFLIRGLLTFGQSYLMKSSGMKLVRETRNRLFSHILYLPVGYFNKESSGVIMSRIINDVEKLEGIFSDVIKSFIVEVPTVVFLLGVAFYRRWDLTLFALILLPLLGYSAKKFGKKIKRNRKEAQRRLSLLSHRISEAVYGSRIIKIFNREDAVSEKFNRESHGYYREVLRVIRNKEFAKLVVDFVTGVGVAAAMWYGVSLIMKGSMTPGDLASILVAVYMIFSPVKKIGEAYNALQETRASMERIDALNDVLHEDRGTISLNSFEKSIEFDNVSFTYPGGKHPVLSNINLKIRSGEIVALVGRSGVGKTTVVDMLPRFNRPTTGSIRIDGINLNDIELYSLRRLIGIVSQDIVLFNDTVRENIAFGRPGATEDEIVAAAKMAYADDFINELPERYETIIGERGLRLSGGQRQRIAIARAILKNPPILILDEATSSLDAFSEKLVQKALEELMKDRTTIVIAHRLSTIKNADRIVIIDRGRVIDTGNHEQLITRSDVYMKLYNAFALS